jgi:hypothetical protein
VIFIFLIHLTTLSAAYANARMAVDNECGSIGKEVVTIESLSVVCKSSLEPLECETGKLTTQIQLSVSCDINRVP